MNPGPRTLRKRQADRSDVRQEFARLERARTGFKPLDSGRAPALHACECLTTPAFKTYPFVVSPMRGGSGRFPSGAWQRLSSSDGITMPQF